MIIPARAPVRPRVISPDGGTVPLEDVVSEFLDSSDTVLLIAGGTGWGKSVALSHVAASVDAGYGVTFLDEPSEADIRAALAGGKVVVAARLLWKEPPNFSLRKFTLAPWTNDDLIEYLLAMLATHPGECGSVMRRIVSAADRTMHHGRPEICVAVVERMAKNENLATVSDALRREIVESLGKAARLQAAQKFCLAALASDRAGASDSFHGLVAGSVNARGVRLLRHDPVQLLLAADGLAAALESPRRCPWLKSHLPRPLVELTGPLLSDAAIERLRWEVRRRDRSRDAMSASLIHATGRGFVPESGKACNLIAAYLSGSDWTGIQLKAVALDKCDLSGSNLAGIMLENATAAGADFSRSVLRDASLIKIQARAANFTEAELCSAKADFASLDGADFTGADLRSASLRGASLRAATLRVARLDGAILSRANLGNTIIDGASFAGCNFEVAELTELQFQTATIDRADFYHARMNMCDFEGGEAPEVKFVGADLLGSNFTSARMPGANFAAANLKGAKLGDVNWEGANLTNAKLCGCTFHFGSSRSGLVGSTIAGEGSRTGFYTDDFDQQTYRPPEEIRKANLCGVDLTGADLTDTDFYLVDLRGAKYSPQQFEYLRRCGAILFDRE